MSKILSNIVLKNVTKTYDKTNTVIPSCNIEIEAGTFTVILGPSGCGKSTLLRMIAGLESTTSGSIEIGGIEVQDKEPKERGCAMVFQNYALYPHMTVEKNIGYSLKVMRLPKKEVETRVAKVAVSMGLTEYLKRQPHELSGGQRQRVAIGRAIAREPKVLLFDEPLSNLDAQLRNEMRIELSDLHRRINSTSVFVTHDQVEAMTLADKILLLNKGNIEQFATPTEIYNRPASVFVGKFIGSPMMNIFNVAIENNIVKVGNVELGEFPTPLQNRTAQLGIRPEHIELTDESGVPFKVSHREDLGSHSILHGVIGERTSISMVTPFGRKIPHTDKLMIRISVASAHFFDDKTLKNLNLYSE